MYSLLVPPARALVALLLRVRIQGAGHLPRRGPVLLAANHLSHLDPLVVAVVLHRLGRRVRFLAVSGLFETRVLGWVLRKTRMIPVVRGAGTRAMVDDARAALAAGQVVLVYPEGAIPPPGVALSGRPGAGLLALEATAPIVPLATWGLLPSPGQRRRRLRRRATVAFGPPMDLSPWNGRRDDAAQLEVSNALLDRVRALQPLR